MDAPRVNLWGRRVALGPLHLGLLPVLTRWENDPRTIELGGDEFQPVTEEVVRARLEPLLRGERAGWHGFAIYALPDLRPIGVANVRDVGTPHRTAEFGITIGDPADRGRGYGAEATRVLLRYAFDELGVHTMLLDTVSVNPAAIGAYQRAGFREIGRIRQARRIGGIVADVVLMECLAREFPAEAATAGKPRQIATNSAH
ncbi:MAG: GNAT family N-acetyltransferase [Thermomicrobiales bacterium]|nr:GNAT family N-acetyltransferase [Thermomicrobiales bacterium]